MEFTTDPDGQELLLKDGKYQVMMEWEKPYMHACIDALKPFGDVLEIGFGLGYSATHIQTYSVKSHTIIECDPTVAQKAREWAKSHSNITIIEDTWQNALPSLGQFDSIFFDDYPLDSEPAPGVLEQLKSASAELETIEKETAHLKPKSYTDQDIQYLLENMGETELPGTFFETFFTSLLKEKQITERQYTSIKEHLEKKGIGLSESLQERGSGDRLIQFLIPILKNHMRAGSRFSCYLERTESLYQNPAFVDLVINDPFLDFLETTTPVTVSPHCKYFKGTSAFIATIQKH